MDYQRIYDQIIDRAKERKLQGYKEKHHIVPKCMGGSNDVDNLVELTAREHFVCHLLLAAMYPNSTKLKYALTSMIFLENKEQVRYVPSSRVTEQVKKQVSEIKKSTCWVHVGGVSRKIPKKDLQEYLSNGYTQGRGQTYNKGKIGMVYEGRTYYVESGDVDALKQRGYVLGNSNKGKRLKSTPGKGKVCIHNQSVTKRVTIEDLDGYLAQGWERGYHYVIDYSKRKNYRLYDKDSN